MSDTKKDLQLKDKEDVAYKKPKMYKLIFLNDDFTTMEFVESIVMEVCHKTQEQAHAFASEVHTKGRAIVGVYTYEIAETKATRILNAAYKEGHPLQVELEPE